MGKVSLSVLKLLITVSPLGRVLEKIIREKLSQETSVNSLLAGFSYSVNRNLLQRLSGEAIFISISDKAIDSYYFELRVIVLMEIISLIHQ